MAEYKYYSDGKRLTVFENSRDKIFRGSLVITDRVVTSPVKVEVKSSSSDQVVQSRIVSVSKPKKKKLTPFELHLHRQEEVNLLLPSSVPVVEELVVEVDRSSNLSKAGVGLVKNWWHFFRFINEVINLMAGLPTRFTGQLSKKIVSLGAVVCLVIALVGYIYAVLPVVAAEISTKIVNSSSVNMGNRVSVAMASPSVNLPPSATPNPTPAPVDLQDFSIYIPKINLSSKIIANVDPNSPEAYKVELQNGVAHAKGSYLPGEGGSVFLFAHSTDTIANILRYSAKFFAVKDLGVGDEILIEFNHNQYKYVINARKIINPSDLDSIRGLNSDLILSTCYPPGTSLQRLIIFAEILT